MSMSDAAFTIEELEQARRLFARECRFLFGVAEASALPAPACPEVAFAGRSNVGKSSLINALTGRRALARTSRTPGRTQQINFFELDSRLRLVDLPGHGYARAAKDSRQAWQELIAAYLRGRVTLRRVCLLVDGRHGLKESDREVMALLDRAAVPYQVVLTKIDEVDEAHRAQQKASLEAEMARHGAALPAVLATSAREGSGIDILRATLAALAQEP